MNVKNNHNIEVDLTNITSPSGLPCRCGSFDHKRTNASECILNKCRIHLIEPSLLLYINYQHDERVRNAQNVYLTENRVQRLNDLQHYRACNKEQSNIQRKENDNIRKESQNVENQKYFNNARSDNFQIANIIGKYVQIENNSTNFGRHIIPKRTQQCQFCYAYVWIEEKRYK